MSRLNSTIAIQRIQAYAGATARAGDPSNAMTRGATVLNGVVRAASTTQGIIDSFVVVAAAIVFSKHSNSEATAGVKTVEPEVSSPIDQQEVQLHHSQDIYRGLRRWGMRIAPRHQLPARVGPYNGAS